MSAAPVARLFASSAIESFPPDNLSPMIPEPTTAATSSAVPIPSAAAARRTSIRAVVTRSVRRRYDLHSHVSMRMYEQIESPAPGGAGLFGLEQERGLLDA